MSSEHLYNLSGNLWPIHPKPLPDELLSSWILRLAYENDLNALTLCTLLFGYRKPIWNRDIDQLASEEILNKLAQVTGTPIERVYETTLKSYDGILFEKTNLSGTTRWVLSLGIQHRKRHAFGLQYCPKCLAEDKKPYFRRIWRLALITTCTKHGVVLLDRCPHCKSPIMPHRVGIHGHQYVPHKSRLIYCCNCNKNLTRTPPLKNADPLLVKSQKSWETALRDGWINWDNNPSMYAFLFFNGVKELSAGLVKHARRSKQTDNYSKLYKLVANLPRIEVELLSIDDRHTLLSEAASHLADWPDNFIASCRSRDMNASTFKRYHTVLPYWYEKPLSTHLLNRHADILPEEARSIENAVEHHYGEFKLKYARELSGRDIAKSSSIQTNLAITDDLFERLLASIDHEIASTTNKTQRLLLLRDKFMFAISRTLKLKIASISRLTIEDVRQRIPEAVEPCFYSYPSTPQQARAWIEWYTRKVRPHLTPKQEEESLFTSPITRSRLKRSAISQRFNRALRAAFLHRDISNYSQWTKPTT